MIVVMVSGIKQGLTPYAPATIYHTLVAESSTLDPTKTPAHHPSYASSSSTTFALTIFTSSTGLSASPVFTSPSLLTTPIPLLTLPNTACFPSSHGAGASVTKNWLPLVSLPELAIERTPAPVCRRAGWISSAKGEPQHEVPPRPVPVGSPACSMKLGIMRWIGVLS